MKHESKVLVTIVFILRRDKFFHAQIPDFSVWVIDVDPVEHVGKIADKQYDARRRRYTDLFAPCGAKFDYGFVHN